MHWIDWAIMIAPLAVCAFIAMYTRRYVRSVSDFMTGGRNAGRFLICTARSEQGAGAVVYVSYFQVFMVAGFTLGWWGNISTPIFLVLSIVGFVIYRYRQTRAMTLGQFFEMRYSRNYRLFAGMLGFFAGLVNFGIIPVIGARFMVVFLDLPQAIHLFTIGTHSIDVATYLPLMALFLTICVIMTTTGGQVSVLLTDCAEGMFSQIFYTFIAITLLIVFFKWSDTRAMLLSAPKGESLVNPFDTANAKNFNIGYVLINIFLGIYKTMAWQNSHAFNSSAATAHESRMGGILGRWRGFANSVMVTLLAVCAMTYLKSPNGQIAVEAAMSHIKDPATRDQMRAPIALTQMLPMGVKGAFLSICLMGIIAGDGIHLHSWGSIFIQDVMMPLRKKPLTPEQHIFYLRLSIVFVALWAFCFGALFPQTKYVQLWWAVTESIFTAGAGVAIIGGLYWAGGNTKGAWSSVIVGSVCTIVGIGAQTYFEQVLHRDFYINGLWIGFLSTLAASASYIIVSLATSVKPHNMDRLLHRGEYAVAGDYVPVADTKKRSWAYRIVMFGIDEQFSRSDKWITIGVTMWSMFWFLVFLVGTAVYAMGKVLNHGVAPWGDSGWATYWFIQGICLPLVIGVITTIWFTIGCWHDIKVFFRKLGEEKIDVHDDGSVSHEPDDEHRAFEVVIPVPAAAAVLPEGVPLAATVPDAHGAEDVVGPR